MTRAREVVVIGAGAAGITAAIRAAEGGARVTLLNAHPRVGLKILMSGGTRCNVTHREVSERDFNTSGSRNVVRRVLAEFPVAKTLEWFESLGVEFRLEATGKYFPVTDNAQTVLDALLARCGAAGVALEAAARVTRLERSAGEDARWRVGIEAVAGSAAFGSGVAAPGEMDWPLPPGEPARWIEADAIVLASGGLSFPRTGSDGTGYALATALGHTLVPPVPALTPLASNDAACAALQGLALDAELSLWIDGRRRETTRGSLLFAHFGYSGPAALDLSRHWMRAEGASRRVTASFAPGETLDSLTTRWTDPTVLSAATVRRLLGERLPARLLERLCEEAGVEPGARIAQVTKAARSALLQRVCERDLAVSGTLGYEKAEVTAGGVVLTEVSPSTLESRVAPGLFLCGEVLDVEGRLGGFNFQWAWSSGTVAGRAAAVV